MILFKNNAKEIQKCIERRNLFEFQAAKKSNYYNFRHFYFKFRFLLV